MNSVPPSASSADLSDYRWLVGEAAELLNHLARDSPPTVRRVSELRQSLTANQTHLLLEQAELRRKGRDKFDRAAEMFFTRRSLEQATSQQIALYKATRFPSGQRIVDLCCGIGGDAIALSASGCVVGVDRDPIMVLLAAANLHAYRCDRFSVHCADVRQTELGDFEAWHFDPDRRGAGKRHSHPQYYEPSVAEFLLRSDRSDDGAIGWRRVPRRTLTGCAKLNWNGLDTTVSANS